MINEIFSEMLSAYFYMQCEIKTH